MFHNPDLYRASSHPYVSTLTWACNHVNTVGSVAIHMFSQLPPERCIELYLRGDSSLCANVTSTAWVVTLNRG